MDSTYSVEPYAMLAIRLRPACLGDARLLFVWRNEPESIRFSRSQAGVSWIEHLRWVRAALVVDRSRIWIAEENGSPVGQVRIDLRGGEAEIDFSIARSRRGHGLGKVVLRLLQRELANTAIKRLVAYVDPRNRASIRSFEGIGFSCWGNVDGYLLFALEI